MNYCSYSARKLMWLRSIKVRQKDNLGSVALAHEPSCCLLMHMAFTSRVSKNSSRKKYRFFCHCRRFVIGEQDDTGYCGPPRLGSLKWLNPKKVLRKPPKDQKAPVNQRVLKDLQNPQLNLQCKLKLKPRAIYVATHLTTTHPFSHIFY